MSDPITTTYSPHTLVSDVVLWLRDVQVPATVLDATEAVKAASALLEALNVTPEVAE